MADCDAAAAAAGPNYLRWLRRRWEIRSSVQQQQQRPSMHQNGQQQMIGLTSPPVYKFAAAVRVKLFICAKFSESHSGRFAKVSSRPTTTLYHQPVLGIFLLLLLFLFHAYISQPTNF
jgi:hypothetical protein